MGVFLRSVIFHGVMVFDGTTRTGYARMKLKIASKRKISQAASNAREKGV